MFAGVVWIWRRIFCKIHMLYALLHTYQTTRCSAAGGVIFDSQIVRTQKFWVQEI